MGSHVAFSTAEWLVLLEMGKNGGRFLNLFLIFSGMRYHVVFMELNFFNWIVKWQFLLVHAKKKILKITTYTLFILWLIIRFRNISPRGREILLETFYRDAINGETINFSYLFTKLFLNTYVQSEFLLQQK